MAKFYIVDGNSLLFRAYYATAYGPNPNIMRTKDGIPTNAIFAFSNMFIKILSNLKPGDGLFVGFDTGHATFRHQEDSTYKANRKPAPEELKIQMPIAREFLNSLDILTLEKEGYEGDDLCGTFAKMAGKEGYEVIVYTSDKDYLQLIDKNISIHLLKTGMSNIAIMNEITMPETYGFQPMQIIDFKGLRGDSSDNICGIHGVGDKTAVKLIQDYGTLENIIEAAKTMKSKVGQSIVENADLGRHCYHLAQIQIDVPMDAKVEDAIYQGYDFHKVNEFCNKYELKSFLNKVPTKFKKDSVMSMDVEFNEIASSKDISFTNEIAISLDIENANYNNAAIYGIAFSFNNKSYYESLDSLKNDQKLQEVLKDSSIKKYCYDYKAIKVALAHENIELNGLYFDALLAAYLLDSTLSNNVDSIMHYFGIDLGNKTDSSLSLFDNSDKERTTKIAYFSHFVSTKALSELEKIECINLYKNIEIPLAEVLAKMEFEGFPIDVNVLETMGEAFKENAKTIANHIYDLAGCEFNIDSPKQVADVLYTKLGLTNNKKNSTSVEALKDLIHEHPIVSEILLYRKYAKLYSTYVVGLTSHVYPDGKIHAMFNQALTQTGRLSSSEPNLQNISIRDEEGKMIRKAFYYPDKNYSILSLDYSQIELRILASLSKCEKLQKVFESGEDIHSATARNVFHVENPTDLQRRRAKAVNFGIIYGISDWGLSEQLECSVKEAKKIINDFYDAYPEISEYFQNITSDVTKNGYVSTLLGRRRYLREVHDSNYQVREFARRAAMNAPIQGTAADLIKIAMIKVDKLLTEKGFETKLILQIHDELLFKVPEKEKDVVLPLIKDVMEHAMDLDVELNVDGGFGHTWYDAK